MDKKFGQDIIVLDIGNISTLADYFIIATGQNNPQIQTLTDTVEETMHKCGINLRHIEGRRGAEWVLMDFGDIFVHIFNKESRNFYNLERIWGDAAVVNM